MPALLRCERVALSYDGRRQAVSELSFEVEAGSILALVGPNGAGKTSTLRMLATLTPPSSGRIWVDGLSIADDPEGVRRRVGYLPDHFALYDALTPVAYLDFFARLYEVDAATRRRRIEELLAELDLEGQRDQPIQSLSRGMRQRLGLAKTLVHDPKVLLLDEPASALDPHARIKLKESLDRLRRRGLAIVVSSHILPDLADLADAVGVMEGGRMLRSGSLTEVARSARLGHTVYRVEVHAHVDRARQVLTELGSRIGELAEPRLGCFEVGLQGGEAAVAELIEALVLRGARVSHVAPRETELEAVYRATRVEQVA